MTTLKSCPFCGKTPDFWYDANFEPIGIHCGCGALVRFLGTMGKKKATETFGETQDRLAERWNRREL